MDRFWSRVEKTPSCWLWTGRTYNGYGLTYVKVDGRWRSRGVHRVAYEMLVGPIPEGLQIDHLCRVRNCVNPDHLEPVTMLENVRRGISPTAINRRKKRCKYGHLFTPENTYYRQNGDRQCVECRRRMMRETIERRSRARARGGQLIANAAGKEYARGSRHHSSRFTESDVRAIREAHGAGNAIRALARMYGVSPMTISNIVKRVNWTHI